jgi:hypothetical protein
MLRGAQLPELCWQANPNRAAKSALDELADDNSLFDCDHLASPEMAAAARALLYFWNGWPAEATMYAQAAPERERAYLAALCARQAGDGAAAKSHLQQVEGHPIYPALAAYALKAIGMGVAPSLRRLRDVIAFGEQWEPRAFADVYEQARSGKLDPPGEKIVCSLQCREFELLLDLCVRAAVGEKPKKARPAPTSPQARPAQRPVPRRHTPEVPSDPKPARPSAKKKVVLKPIPALEGVSVLCPKCGAALTFPEGKRGTPGRCSQCGASFLIPDRPGAKSTSQASNR